MIARVHRGRPQAEFVGGLARRVPRRPESPVRIPDTTQVPHLDLRVVRMVNAQFTCEREDWRDFLDDLGTDNHPLGSARSLGAVGITYVPSKHMNGMLADKYPRDYHDPRRKIGLFRRVSAGLGAFIRSECQIAFDEQTAEVERDITDRRQAWREEEINALFRELGMAEDMPPETVATLTEEDQARLESHRFGPANLAVRGLDFYGKSRFGLDLAGNEITYEERFGLIGFLRGELGLDTTVLDAGWRPHATVFRMHEHVPVPDKLTADGYMPVGLAFLPPKPEGFGF